VTDLRPRGCSIPALATPVLNRVGSCMCHPPCLDPCGICGGVMQSVTAVCRGDQGKFRARRQWKDRNALRCISKRSNEMIHSLSLIRHWVNTRRTTNDNDKPRLSALFRRTKIRSFDPLLTTVLTAHPTQPLSPLFHPPVERAAS
jgi:hypothetical protein